MRVVTIHWAEPVYWTKYRKGGYNEIYKSGTEAERSGCQNWNYFFICFSYFRRLQGVQEGVLDQTKLSGRLRHDKGSDKQGQARD